MTRIDPALLGYALVVTVLTALLGPLYIRWRRTQDSSKVPNGFGVLLAPIMLGAAVWAQAPFPFVIALVVGTIAALVYWLDDLHELSARLRMAISVATGVGIGLAFFGSTADWVSALSMAVTGAIICVALTNAVNFYDGADLNLATYIGLTAVLVLGFGGQHREWAAIAFAALGFVLAFGRMNAVPRTMYLGDSGSFAFAVLLTIMAAAFARDVSAVPPEAAIAAALPTFDTAFVFALRVREGHDLLSRNYLHLYQRLNRAYLGFGYLLPQIANVILCLVAAHAFQLLGMGRILSVIVAMVGVTIPSYFIYRHIFLLGKPIGPAATNG